MTAKHTPGPWVADISNQAVTSNGDILVDVFINNDLATAKANTTLIAAAPELLALLEEIEASYKQWDDYAEFRYSMHAKIDSIEAIIAKAKGET